MTNRPKPVLINPIERLSCLLESYLKLKLQLAWCETSYSCIRQRNVLFKPNLFENFNEFCTKIEKAICLKYNMADTFIKISNFKLSYFSRTLN